MTAQLTLRFEHTDDLMRVLLFLRDNGLEKLVFQPKRPKKPLPAPKKRTWEGLGSVNVGTALDTIPNLRDFAYE